MSTGDRDFRTHAGSGSPPEARYPPQQPYRIQHGYSPSQQLRPAWRGYPAPYDSGRMPVQAPAEPPPLVRSAGPMPAHRQPRQVRRRTWPQLVGGVLIAGACVATAAWYVPRVMADDRLVITGTVASSGVVALNFAASGQIGRLNVHLNQEVRKGEVLAVE